MTHPLRAIAAIIERRLHGGEADSSLRALVADKRLNDVAWVKFASRHRVAPALGACLDDLGLKDSLPEDLGVYLTMMRENNADRSRQLLDELGRSIARLNTLGVEPCLIKGSARLVDQVYPDIAWRFMDDLDLLVPEERLEDCSRVLQEDGYEALEIDRQTTHHGPPLWHPERETKIELHLKIRCKPFYDLMPTDVILARAQSINGPLGRFKVLDPTDQATLLIAHSQVFNGDVFYGIIRLAHLIELDRLVSTHDLDWEVIQNGFQTIGWRRSYVAFLWAAQSFFQTPIPNAGKSDLIFARWALRRFLAQQYWPPAMFIGICAGWCMHTAHRMMTMPDRKEMVRLVGVNVSNKSEHRFVGLRKMMEEYL